MKYSLSSHTQLKVLIDLLISLRLLKFLIFTHHSTIFIFIYYNAEKDRSHLQLITDILKKNNLQHVDQVFINFLYSLT